MQKFNFTQLVDDYSREITVITKSDGYYNESGDYVKGEEKETTMRGAVIRHRESKVYKSNGTLTLNDYALYLTEKPDIDLIGSEVKVDNQKFKVENTLDNSEFTGVWSFNLKFCSAFKEGDKW